MDHPQKLNDALLKDLSALIRDDLDDAARRITQKTPAARLRNLQSTVYAIDAPVVHRAAPLERYMAEWHAFVRGNRGSLERRAVRFLCWVPEVAVDPRFLASVQGSGAGLELADPRRPRPLVPLHVGGPAADNRVPPSSKRSAVPLQREQPGPRQMAGRLRGPPRGRWTPGHGRQARSRRNEPPGLHRRMAHRAPVGFLPQAGRGRDRLVPQPDRPARPPFLVLFFRDLLPWPGWKPSAFKKEIGALIRHDPMDDRSREAVQRFILHFEGLGDPRLAANRVKWAEVDEQARQRLIGWLNRESPYAFSEHVYRQGKGWVWKRKTSLRDPLSFEDGSDE